MTQKLRAVYNNSDKTIIGFLAEDLDAEDHEARCPEGVKVTSNYLEFDYAFRTADKFSSEAFVGGTDPIYSASFASVPDQQVYDLQQVVSSSQSSNDWSDDNYLHW